MDVDEVANKVVVGLWGFARAVVVLEIAIMVVAVAVACGCGDSMVGVGGIGLLGGEGGE